MCRRDNFRVKVDLSKFYDDVRRSSWIYVDKASISTICHLQNHIIEIFNVQMPFHLLLNSGEYLPPNEDPRVLKEDETILVVPGTGLQNDYSNHVESGPKADIDTSRIISHSKQRKKRIAETEMSPKIKVGESSDGEDDVCPSMETTSGNTVFLSMINDSQMESASESKAEVSAPGEISVSEISPLKNKRKRVRRRKSKIATEPDETDQLPVNGAVQVEYKKPKILNSVTIPNGKHIRFGDAEKHEFQGYDSSASNDSKKLVAKVVKNGSEESYWDKRPPMTGSSLSNLLALRQSSTPITFARKKIDEESQSQVNSETREVRECEVEQREIFKKEIHGLTVDPKKHPLMENKARVNDVVAFKMLKMGSDYTPQISEYIVAQSIQILPDRSTYMFKILEGKDEIQAPQGKFDLDTEETENTDTEVIALNWSQLIEPRLIYRE